MTSAESISIFEDMKATFPDAVVSVAVKTGENTTVMTDGIRTNMTTSRVSSGRGGLTESIDVSVIVLASAFADKSTLRGRSAIITKGEITTAVRLISTKEHALGGLLVLNFGDYDRVTA